VIISDNAGKQQVREQKVIACVVCNTSTDEAFVATVLSKHEISYFYCSNCGLLQTEEPYWLDEAYGRAIASADTGILARNLSFADQAARILYPLFGPKGRYLDWAGGTGLLVRRMRDLGFDFFWQDPYCNNALAYGFEDDSEYSYSAVTAVEVLEHLIDPVDFIKKACARSATRTLVCTTEIFEGNAPPSLDWAYYAFAEGQHIRFYQQRTLEMIAKKLGLNFYSDKGIHIFTELEIPSRVLSGLKRRNRNRALKKALAGLESKTQSDSTLMLSKAAVNQ